MKSNKYTAFFVLSACFLATAGSSPAQSSIPIDDFHNTSIEDSDSQLQKAAATFSNHHISRTEWCLGDNERFLCAYDQAGQRMFWVKPFVHHVRIWTELTNVTCGYPAIQQMQKEYNARVALPAFAVGGYALSRSGPFGWQFGADIFSAPSRLSDLGCYDLLTLRIPFYLEARRTIAVWDRFKADCRDAAAGQSFSGCQWELFPRLLEGLIKLSYPNQWLTMRGEAIRKALKASLEYNQLIDQLIPASEEWENKVDADDVRSVRGHLEPDQLSADFLRRQSEAIDAIYRTNAFAEMLENNEVR